MAAPAAPFGERVHLVSQMDRRQALRLFAGLGATGLLAACGTTAPQIRRRHRPVSDRAGQNRPDRAADRRLQGDRRRHRPRLPAVPGAERPAARRPPGAAAHRRRGRHRRVRQGRAGRAAQAGRARADRRRQLGRDARHPGHRRAGAGAAGRLQRLAGRPAERRLHLAHVVREQRARPGPRPVRRRPDQAHRARSASSRRTTPPGATRSRASGSGSAPARRPAR